MLQVFIYIGNILTTLVFVASVVIAVAKFVDVHLSQATKKRLEIKFIETWVYLDDLKKAKLVDIFRSAGFQILLSAAVLLMLSSVLTLVIARSRGDSDPFSPLAPVVSTFLTASVIYFAVVMIVKRYFQYFVSFLVPHKSLPMYVLRSFVIFGIGIFILAGLWYIFSRELEEFAWVWSWTNPLTEEFWIGLVVVACVIAILYVGSLFLLSLISLAAIFITFAVISLGAFFMRQVAQQERPVVYGLSALGLLLYVIFQALCSAYC
jgi:hypothetical protein